MTPVTPATPPPATASPIRLVTPDEHTPLTTQTPGMERCEVLSHPAPAGGGPGVWVGLTRTAPGNLSGWHHHGDFETYIYVQSGSARFEFGPGGRGVCDARAGDLLHVPRGAVHREANHGREESVLLILRVGAGEPVYNVDGPAS